MAVIMAFCSRLSGCHSQAPADMMTVPGALQALAQSLDEAIRPSDPYFNKLVSWCRALSQYHVKFMLQSLLCASRATGRKQLMDSW
jgi:hypothetical protein